MVGWLFRTKRKKRNEYQYVVVVVERRAYVFRQEKKEKEEKERLTFFNQINTPHQSTPRLGDQIIPPTDPLLQRSNVLLPPLPEPSSSKLVPTISTKQNKETEEEERKGKVSFPFGETPKARRPTVLSPFPPSSLPPLPSPPLRTKIAKKERKRTYQTHLSCFFAFALSF